MVFCEVLRPCFSQRILGSVSNFLAPVIHCRHAIPPFANTACAQIWLLLAFGVLRVAMGKEESIQFDSPAEEL